LVVTHWRFRHINSIEDEPLHHCRDMESRGR